MDEVKAPKIKRRRKRIRSLAYKPQRTQRKQPAKSRLTFYLKIGVALALIFVAVKNGTIFEDLKHLSMNQYQLYLHGRQNYCSERFEYQNITDALEKRLYGQENVLNEIKLLLQHHDNITGIALIGSQGVGKTLTLNVIQEKFQWHLNVQQFIWSTIESQQNQLNSLLKLLKNLSTCGQNSIFVDNIRVAHTDIIKEFHQNLVNLCRKNHFKVIVFYVFVIDDAIQMGSNSVNDEINANAIQFDGVKSIYFRRFNLTDLHKCILVESERLQLQLLPQQIEDTLADIDVKRTGCKTVAAKISRYTTAPNYTL